MRLSLQPFYGTPPVRKSAGAVYRRVVGKSIVSRLEFRRASGLSAADVPRLSVPDDAVRVSGDVLALSCLWGEPVSLSGSPPHVVRGRRAVLIYDVTNLVHLHDMRSNSWRLLRTRSNPTHDTADDALLMLKEGSGGFPNTAVLSEAVASLRCSSTPVQIPTASPFLIPGSHGLQNVPVLSWFRKKYFPCDSAVTAWCR